MPKKGYIHDSTVPDSPLDLGIHYVRDAVAHAFPVSPIPREHQIISHHCDECFRVRDDFAGRRWPEVPRPVIEYHSDSLPLFAPAAFHYYLPAYLSSALCRDRAPGHILLDMVIYSLCPDTDDWWRNRFSAFSPVQLRASAGWLRFVLSHEEQFWPDMRVGQSGYEHFWQQHEARNG